LRFLNWSLLNNERAMGRSWLTKSGGRTSMEKRHDGQSPDRDAE